MALPRLARRFVLAALVLAAPLALVNAPPASAWASVNTATIRPGNQMITNGSQCTSNFVYTNGADVLLGMAAHCAAPGESLNGCENGSFPLGTAVEIQGAKRPGTLVYSSWGQMRATGETRENLCLYNDFALVRVDPSDVRFVNPTVPRWGGPTGVATAPTKLLSKLYSYGNSQVRLGLRDLSPKRGFGIRTLAGGWSHRMYFVTPGIPGDSGMGVMNANGRALGLLSTIQYTPLVASNGVTDLNSAMNYAKSHGVPGLTLALGQGFRTL